MNSYQLVASGGLGDLGRLKDYEFELEEGQRARVRLDLRSSVPAAITQQLEKQLKERGVTGARVTTGGKKVDIQFRKGFPLLAVIAAIILALTVLAILIISWSIFKEVIPETFQPALATTGLVLLFAVVAAIALSEYRR